MQIASYHCGLLFLGLENNVTIVVTYSFARKNNSPQSRSVFYTDRLVKFLRKRSCTLL